MHNAVTVTITTKGQSKKITCRAQESYKGVRRFDCVQLKQSFQVDGVACQYARLVWIVSGIDATCPVCIGIPLAQATTLQTNSKAQMMAAKSFKILIHLDSFLLAFRADQILQLEQILFMKNPRCSLAIVNHFIYSNIAKTVVEDEDIAMTGDISEQ